MSNHTARGNTADKKNVAFRIFLPILTIVSALFLYFFIHKYANDFQAVFSEETQGYMREIARQATLTINNRVNSDTKNAETIAAAVAGMSQTDPEPLTEFLKNEARRYGYTSLLLVNTDGLALSHTGNLTSVSRRKHYLSALQGIPSISGIIHSDFDNTESIEFAVPIQTGDTTNGVLISGYSLNDFKDILQTDIFGGYGSVSVIDSLGVVIVRGEEGDSYNFSRFLKDNPTLDRDEYARFVNTISSGGSGTLQYMDKGQSLMTYYQPLGINDWYILVSTTTEQITGKTNLFLSGMTYIGLAVAAIISFLMMLILLLQRKNRKALERLLYVDPITGGYSFARFELEAGKRISEKSAGYYALMQLNLERFKLINTSFGREVGNELLRYVYTAIYAGLRSDELAARVTADRFCLLLQYHSREDMAARLETIGEMVNQFNVNQKNKYFLHFDAGSCIVDSERPDISMLYERANFSRTHGGSIKSAHGSLAFYDEVERNVVVREKEIENRMEEALAVGEFEAFFQPKYELENDTVAGAEALVRWRDPQRGMISPGEFIPLFERNGFIVKLDLWMFEQVCILLHKRWTNSETCVPVSVNLSRRHLEHQNFLSEYREIYARYSFPPHFIEIELTESIVFDNMQLLCAIIDEIHEFGFECSMDDFGSGYSSLNMLKDIPVDTLKLDRAFFYSKNGDLAKSHYVVDTIIDLARKLNIKTVSEGIETVDQLDFLRRARCDMVQGYVFAKPMPSAQFEELLGKK